MDEDDRIEESVGKVIALFQSLKKGGLNNTLIVGPTTVEEIGEYLFKFCYANQLTLNFISYDKEDQDLLCVECTDGEKAWLLAFNLQRAADKLEEVKREVGRYTGEDV